MIKQSDFKKLVQLHDIESIKLHFEDENFDPSYNDNCFIRFAVEVGATDIFKLLLNDPRVDPSADDNEAIAGACYNGFTEIVELLLLDKRVDPSHIFCFQYAYQNRHLEITELLWKDKRVQNTLKKENITLYTEFNEKHIKIKLDKF